MEYLKEEPLASPTIDLNWVRYLIDLVEREDLSELIVSEGKVTIIIRGKSYQPANFVPYSYSSTAPPASAAELQEIIEVGHKLTDTVATEKLFHITAPLTGIFYSRPNPNAPPFVTVGSEVEPDQVVALVEAMKFFNEVRSEVRGIVREIMAKDGQLVKHGDTLIVLERID